MRFKGWLRSPGEAHQGLPVAVDVEDTGVTVSTGDRQLGWWAPNDVELERGEGTSFLLRVDDEQWFFEPTDPMRLLFEGLPLLALGKVQSAGVSDRELARARRIGDVAAGPERVAADPKPPRASAVPSVVWGLLTATLLFGGVLIGVLVGRFRADGPNFVTGVTMFGTLVVGFYWGRLLWQRASQRRVPTSAGTEPVTGPPVGALPRSATAAAGSDSPPTVSVDEPSPEPVAHANGADPAEVAGSQPPRTDSRLRVRGDRGLIGLVLGDGFEVQVEDRPPPPEEPPVDPNTPDDLQAIKGIGPKTEQILIDLGHTTYEDVALLLPEQIEEIQEHLGNFKNRIYSDGWCLSAARLYRQKYGAFPARKLEAGLRD